jgi:hypothetical protein
MIKRMLPLLVGLAASGAALAQDAPAAARSTVPVTQETTVTTWATEPASGALSEEAVKTAIANAGYKEVKGLKFKDGVWRTEARGGNDKWSKLAVGPATGRVYPADAPSKLNEDEVKAKLSTAGYSNARGVRFDNGLWSADADTAQGHTISLLVDPFDGSVVAKSQ